MSNDDELNKLRQRIDALDQKILELMAERVDAVREIGRYKHGHRLPVLDERRWEAVIESRSAWAGKLGLSSEFTAQLYDLIHRYALEVEAKEVDRT